jgi:predicted N-acyltransferase
MTRQGLKFGLRSEVGMQHLDDFYEIYASSVHNLGSPVFPRRLFHALAAEFGKECELLTVWRNDRMISGVLTLLYEDQALPYYGGALREGLQYAVNDFMYWSLMCHVAAAGYRVFDFGRSREGTGPYNFKRHWGFEPEPLPYHTHCSRCEDAEFEPVQSQDADCRRDLEALAAGVTKLAGPFLTRFLP